MGLLSYLKSTILSKIVMAGTGVILVLFMVGHTLGNMQIYLGPEAFNAYAHFLQGLGELLWVIRLSLALALILHIITSIRLYAMNAGAKPVKYQVKRYVEAKLTGRTMLPTGIMIFAFFVYHILHFTSGKVHSEFYGVMESYGPNGIFERHDVYHMVISSFQQPIISIAYIVGVILLGSHLNHAIQSAFQTLGFNNPKHFENVVKYSRLFSILLVLALISLPITILTGLVGGCS